MPPPEETPDQRLAVIHAQAERGELAAARDALAALVRDAPLLAAAHRFMGLLALEANDGPMAIESLRRATFLDADDPLAQFGLGRAYLALGDGGRASAAFRQARRALAPLQPDDAVPGDVALSVDKLRRAIEAQLSSLGDNGGERR
jgi:predicted Zn-dependent protease